VLSAMKPDKALDPEDIGLLSFVGQAP